MSYNKLVQRSAKLCKSIHQSSDSYRADGYTPDICQHFSHNLCFGLETRKIFSLTNVPFPDRQQGSSSKMTNVRLRFFLKMENLVNKARYLFEFLKTSFHQCNKCMHSNYINYQGKSINRYFDFPGLRGQSFFFFYYTYQRQVSV